MRISPAARVAIIYAVAGALWIVLTDHLLTRFFSTELGPAGQTVKGLFYVAASGALIYILVRTATARLRRSEENYRAIFQANPDTLLLIEASGRVRDVNEHGLSHHGLARKDFIGRTVTELAPPETAQEIPKLLEDGLSGHTEFSWRYPLPDGRFLDLAISARPVEVDGEPCMLADVRDMTAAVRAQERFQAIFTKSTDPMCLADIDAFRFTEVNQALADVLGYAADDLLSRPFLDFVHPDDVPVTRAVVEDTLRTGQSLLRFENRYRRPDGSYCWLEWTAHEVSCEGAVFAIAHDVTGRKEEERRLRESEARYRAYVGHSPVGIFIADGGGKFVDVNPAACAMLGYAREELLGLSVRDVGPALDGEGGDFDALKESESLRGEIQLRRRDGSTACAILDAVALDGGRYLGFCTDISRRRAAEARVGHLNAMLRSLRHVDRVITGARDQNALIEGVCQGLTRERGFSSAWAFLVDARGAVTSVASVGLGALEKQLRERVASGQLPQCAHTALENQRAVCVERTANGCSFCPMLDQDGSTASMAACLAYDGLTRGALVATVPARMAGDSEELDLFGELASDVSYALRSLEVEAARRHEEEQRRLYERIVSNVGAPMAFLDEHCRYRAANEAYLDRFQVSWAELEGKTPAAVVGDEIHRERIEPAVSQCMAGEEVRYETWYDFPQLGERCMVYQYYPYQDARRITGAIVIGADITSVKRAEESVRRSEAELRAIFDSAQDAIYLKDASFRYIRVNYALEEMLGRPAADILGKAETDLFPAEDAGEIRRVDERVLQGESVRGEYVRSIRGEERHVESTKAPIRDGHGRIVGLCGVTRDVTERKRLEEQLLQAQKMEAVGQLAGGVAHDFNNLLQVINGHVDLMLMEMSEDAPLREDLQEVEKAGGRAAGLVGQLLAFSRRQIMKPEDLNINDVIGDLMKMLVRVLGEHIRIEFVPGHRLGITRGDRGMMEQVVMNLCVNARDAMPGGGALVIETQNVYMDADYCDTHAWAKPGRYVLLRITDTGSGMDAGTMARVFEPFYTTKEPGKGTGLGLSTVYGIVHQHEGTVQVYSELNKGTTFKVYLPVVERTASDVGAVIEGAPEGGAETILLAEDDAMVSNLARRALERAGYTVLIARDGEEAVLVFRQNSEDIDLCVFDVVMPRMGGKEAYDRIQQIREGVPVMYASGYSENVVHTNFVLRRGLTLLQKPFSCDHLLRTVRRVLDGGAPSQG